jgi:hypothetical protein
MAQQALGAGTTVPRKRVLFGALDADGWAWAGVKATFWLVVIIMMLGYIPDRAYYLTVNRTVQLGVLVWSPVNFCPPENESLPCPAPVGAVAPWHPSPTELALPEARTDGAAVQLGTKFLYIGGTGADGAATSTVYVAPTSGTGNFDAWAEGPALPEPRTDASVLLVSGSIYVIGGRDATGAPTRTIYSLTPNATTGALGDWVPVKDALLLPEGRAGTAAVAAPTGVILVGGENADGPVTTVWKSPLADDGTLQPWEPEASLVHPQADGAAWIIGDYVWLWGGHDASGPVGAVQRGTIGLAAAEGLPEDPNEGKVVQWAVSDSANLPAARDNAATWSANGALYLVGGEDGSGPQGQLFWTIPSTEGDITGWQHLDVSDLPFGLTGGSAVVSGPNAIIVGGETTEGVTSSSARANVAPLSPFFQLGLAGATIPGLKIEGEIGQQLGYLNAAGAGTVNFIILLLIGWGFAHKEQARAMIRRVLRR